MEKCDFFLKIFIVKWCVVIFYRNLIFRYNKNIKISDCLRIKISVIIILGIDFLNYI